MAKPLVFKPTSEDISPEQIIIMKDYILAVRYFGEEDFPSFSGLLLEYDGFDFLQPDFINEVSRLKDAGFLDRQVEFYASLEHDEPFCKIGPSPAFLARLDYNVFEGSKEA